MRVKMLLLGAGIVFFASQSCRAQCIEHREALFVWCLKTEMDSNGQPEDIHARVPIRTKADPQDPNATVWGSFKVYKHDTDAPGDDCDSGKKNCQDEDYTYADIDIDENWSVTDQMTGRTWTKADNERYWDEIYQGYTQLSGIDYTKNCHGYTFGVGDWVEVAVPGVDILINNPSGQVGQPVCYLKNVSECAAEIAVQTDRSHSMKIISCKVCEDPAGVIEGITETREKFRESGVYKKTAACVDSGIDPGNPKTDGVNDAFTLCKKNTTP